MFKNTQEMFNSTIAFIAKKNREMTEERKIRYYAPVQSVLEVIRFLLIAAINAPFLLLQTVSLLVVLVFEKMSVVLFNDDENLKSATISDVYQLVKKQAKGSFSILNPEAEAPFDFGRVNNADRMIHNIGELISGEFKRELPDSGLAKAWAIFGKFILVIYALITFSITIPVMLLKQFVVEPILNHVLPFLHLNITTTLFNALANLPLRLLDGLQFLVNKCTAPAMDDKDDLAKQSSVENVQADSLTEPRCFPCFSWWKKAKEPEAEVHMANTPRSMKV